MICYIYKITCLCGSFKDHYYIGQRRYKGRDVDMDRYTGSGKLIKDYFKKYGFDRTYTKQILEIVPTKELLNQREKIYVGDLWETDHLCLNLCAGGYSSGWSEESRNRLSLSQKEYFKNHPFSEEKKRRLSEMFKGENNPFYGKKHSEKTRVKMSANHANFSGDNHPSWGKKRSKEFYDWNREKALKWHKENPGALAGDKNPAKKKEVREKISKSRKSYFDGNPDSRRKISLQRSKRVHLSGNGLEKDFDSIQECAIFIGLSPNSRRLISDCCLGRKDSYNGYNFNFII